MAARAMFRSVTTPALAWGDAGIEQILVRADELGVFPAAISRIQSVVASPDSSLVELERAVSMDSALSGQVLKISNSSFYGLRARVGSLRQALCVLGFESTRLLALGMLTAARPKTPSPRAHELWRHALRTGILARLCAESFRGVDPGLAFVLGATHDIGERLLYEVGLDGAAEGSVTRGLVGASLAAAERVAHGFDHAQLGAACLARWALPDQLVQIVKNHHAPTAPHGKLAAILQVADELEPELVPGQDPAEACRRVASELRSAPDLQLDAPMLLGLVNDLAAETRALLR